MTDPSPDPAVERLIEEIDVWFCDCDERRTRSASEVKSLLRELAERLTRSEHGRAEAEQQRDELLRRANRLQHELLDLITLMPDSQTDEIVDYITSLRRGRGRPVPWEAERDRAISLLRSVLEDSEGTGLYGDVAEFCARLPAAREAGSSNTVPTVSDGETKDTSRVTSHPPTEAP